MVSIQELRTSWLLDLRQSMAPPLCQGCLESVRIEVPTVCWRARVLPPRVRERTGVDGIEADCVDQAEHDFLALRIISGNGEAEPSRCLERYTVCFNAGSLGVNSSIIAA